MALVVEDGSGVANANAYVDVAGYRAWATARGLPLPSDDSEGNTKIEQAIYKATDYLETIPTFGGETSEDDQSLSFPRKCLYISGKLFAVDKIPKQIVLASYQLVAAVLAGVDLMPNVSGNASDYVKREKVGPIETEYASATDFDGQTTLTSVNALLALLLDAEGPMSFRVDRG